MSNLLRLLIDAGVGKAVEQWLITTGHDVASVRDADPQMTDSAILNWAVKEQRIVVTMDKDFGEIVYLSGQPHTGVLLLRLEDADSAEKVRIVEAIVTNHSADLPGRFCVFQDGYLRIR